MKWKTFPEVTAPKSNESTNSTTSAYSVKNYRKERYKFRPNKAKQMIEKIISFFQNVMPMDSQKMQSRISFNQSMPCKGPITSRKVSIVPAKKEKIPTRNTILRNLGISLKFKANPPEKASLRWHHWNPMSLPIPPHPRIVNWQLLNKPT